MVGRLERGGREQTDGRIVLRSSFYPALQGWQRGEATEMRPHNTRQGRAPCNSGNERFLNWFFISYRVEWTIIIFHFRFLIHLKRPECKDFSLYEGGAAPSTHSFFSMRAFMKILMSNSLLPPPSPWEQSEVLGTINCKQSFISSHHNRQQQSTIFSSRQVSDWLWGNCIYLFTHWKYKYGLIICKYFLGP